MNKEIDRARQAVLNAMAEGIKRMEARGGFPTQAQHAARIADSMKVFCDGEPGFVWGEWKAWQQACQQQGKALPPSDFKKDRGVA